MKKIMPCPECDGTGEITYEREDDIDYTDECPVCDGTGTVEDDTDMDDDS